MISDAEFIFWCVLGVISTLTMCATPLICNYMENKRIRKMFEER